MQKCLADSDKKWRGSSAGKACTRRSPAREWHWFSSSMTSDLPRSERRCRSGGGSVGSLNYCRPRARPHKPHADRALHRLWQGQAVPMRAGQIALQTLPSPSSALSAKSAARRAQAKASLPLVRRPVVPAVYRLLHPLRQGPCWLPGPPDAREACQVAGLSQGRAREGQDPACAQSGPNGARLASTIGASPTNRRYGRAERPIAKAFWRADLDPQAPLQRDRTPPADNKRNPREPDPQHRPCSS